MTLNRNTLFFSANDGGTPLTAGSGTDGPVKLNSIIASVQSAFVLSSTTLNTPPVAVEGQSYFVAAGALGAWAGQSGKIATFVNATWVFSAPIVGLAYGDATNGNHLAWDGAVWTVVGGGGGGNTSIFTDNGNGSFTHDDGTGTTVLLDVPSELINNIGNAQMRTLLNNTFDASNTASVAEIAALTGSELMWVELASGNVEKVKMSDLVNPNILPNPNSVGQVFTDWFVGYAFVGDPGGSGGGGLVLPAGPPGVNGHWEAIAFPQGFIQLTRTDTLSIIPGAVGVPGDTIGYADGGGGNETVRGGFGWRATS